MPKQLFNKEVVHSRHGVELESAFSGWLLRGVLGRGRALGCALSVQGGLSHHDIVEVRLVVAEVESAMVIIADAALADDLHG